MELLAAEAEVPEDLLQHMIALAPDRSKRISPWENNPWEEWLMNEPVKRVVFSRRLVHKDLTPRGLAITALSDLTIGRPNSIEVLQTNLERIWTFRCFWRGLRQRLSLGGPDWGRFKRCYQLKPGDVITVYNISLNNIQRFFIHLQKVPVPVEEQIAATAAIAFAINH
ncbi:uncharacterized protein [Spinacia oleracea]|uniref:TF-B3 domain-containing protein n=1 Tax=Spinacia oleracea TaxID=3562 RepID=A0A9R0JLH5_SPIOL|nr:uncharacterized protein LOC110778894 [Spinacia oleracea]